VKKNLTSQPRPSVSPTLPETQSASPNISDLNLFLIDGCYGKTSSVDQENCVSSRKLVVVEDEPDILELLSYNFQRDGYEVHTATNGKLGLELIQRERPDLALLDIMLPSMDGLEICRNIKNNPLTRHTRVIMLSAKNEESDIVLGLGVGADDFRLLEHLASNPGRVFSREQLLTNIGGDFVILGRNIDVHIGCIRKKLQLDDPYIETIRGLGYRMVTDGDPQ